MKQSRSRENWRVHELRKIKTKWTLKWGACLTERTSGQSDGQILCLMHQVSYVWAQSVIAMLDQEKVSALSTIVQASQEGKMKRFLCAISSIRSNM